MYAANNRVKPLAAQLRKLNLTEVKDPLHADGTSESATRQSRSRLVILATATAFGTLGGLIGYTAASAIRDCAVCAASRSPITVALYVASAATLAAWGAVARS